jgi:hypothetical protein
MTALTNAADVRDNTEDRRFEIWVDGELTGFTTDVVTSVVIRLIRSVKSAGPVCSAAGLRSRHQMD